MQIFFDWKKMQKKLFCYALAPAAVLITFYLKRVCLDQFNPGHSVFLIYILPITVSAWFGGLGPGLLASAIAAVTVGEFSSAANIFSVNFPVRVAIFLMQGTVISLLLENLHRSRTEFQRIARENEQLAEKATTASKVKDDFLAMVSHDLRTPLTAMKTYIYLLKKENLSPGQIGHFCESLSRGLDLQTRLINDLLDSSRIASGKLALEYSEIGIDKSIAEAIETIRPTAEHKFIAIDFHGSSAGVVKGDSVRLQQVFCNLLANAIKFTPEGGKISIEVTGGENPDQVQVSVKDNGCGIEPAFLSRIFERFQQVQSARQGGLGLGLFIARHIVELHGGSIRAESAGAGKGAAFIVTLPLANKVMPANAALLQGRAV